MMLAYCGMPFTTCDVQFADWPALKEDKAMFPYGCMPVATINGCRMGQTRSQMRFIATQAGLYNPKDAKCAYANDSLMDMWDDVCSAS